MNSSRFFSQFSNLNIAKNIFSSRVVSLKRFSKHYLYNRRRNLHNHLFKSRKYNFHLLNRKFNFFKKKMNTISFELGRHFRQPLSRRVRYIASISKFPSYFLRRLFVSNNAIKTIKTCFSSNSKSFNRHQFAYFRNSFRRRPFFSRGVIRFYTSSLGFIRKRHSFLKSRQIFKKKHISTRFIKPKFGISHLKKNIKLNSVSSYYRRRFFFFRKIKHKNYFSKKSILFSTKVGLLKRLLLKRRNHLGYRLNYIQKKLKVVPEVFFSPKTQHYKFFMSKLRSYTRFFIKRMFKSKSRYRHLYKLPLKLRTSNKKSYYRLQRQRRYVSSRPKKYYNRFLLLQSRFFSKKYNPGFKKFMKLKSKIKDNRNKKRVPFILKKNSNAMVNYYNPYYLNSKLYMQFISFIKSGFMPVNFNRSFFLKSFFKKIKRRRHKLFKQRLMYFSNIFDGIKRKKAKKKIGIKRKHKRLCRLFTSNYFRPTSTSVPGINVLNYFSPHFSSNFSSAYSYRFICNLKRLCNRMHSLKFKKKRLKFNNDFLLKVRSLYRRFKKRIKNKTKRSIYSLRSTVPWYSWSHFISNYKTSDNCSNVFRSKPKSRRGFFFDARYRKYMIFKRKPKVKKTMVPSYIRSNYNSRKKNTFGFQRRYYSRFFDKRFSGVKKSKYLNFKNRRKRMPSDLMFRRYYIMNNRYFKNKLSRRVLYFFRRLISSRRRSSFFSFFRLSRPINNFRSIRFYFNRIFSLASKKIRSGSKSSLLESSSYFNYFIFSRFISFIRNINLHSSLSSSYHLPNYFSKSMIISSFSRFNSYFNVSSSSKSVLYPIYYNFYSNFNNDFTDQNLLPSFLRFFLKQKISFFFKFYKKFLHSFVVISSYWFNIKSYFYRSFSRLFPYLLSSGNKNYFSVFFFSSIMNKYLFFFNRLFFFRCFLLGFYKSLNVAKFKSSKVRSFISYFSSIFSSKRFVSHKSMYFSKKFKLLRRVYFFNRYNDSRFKRHIAHFTLLNRNRIKKKRFFRRLKLRRHHSKFNTFRSFVRKRIKSRLVFIQDFFRKAIVQFNNTVHFCLSSYLNTSVLLHFRYYIGSSRPFIKSASLVSDFMCYELKKGVPINEVLGDLNFWFRNDRMSKSRLKKKINVHRRGFSKSVRRYDYIDFSSDSLSSYFRNKMLMNNNENRYYLDKLDTFASKFRLNLRYSSFFTVHGFKVVCSGRPFGQPRTTSYLRFFKRMPFSTIDYHVDYSYNYAITKYGMVGIKVWVFFG
jgi:hypothetical protein